MSLKIHVTATRATPRQAPARPISRIYLVHFKSEKSTLPSMPTFRTLPDANSSLYTSRDFILGSSLARRALEVSAPRFATFIADLLDATHRLAQSCHLPEFTDHGLPHLCSLIDRVSSWELPIETDKSQRTLAESLTPDQAKSLLVALLTHDLGMLSQKPVDLPVSHSSALNPSQWSDMASWVRRTHVVRLPRLIRRVMATYSPDYSLLFDRDHPNNLCDAIEIATAHQQWPWEWSGNWQLQKGNRGLAAVVSVADLLDEDSARCDTETLLQHRGGNELNRAHWIRHALTSNRVGVLNGAIHIWLCRPPDTGRELKPVFSALRNHFRLVLLYESELQHIAAPITHVHLHPSTGLPEEVATNLARWRELDGFENESAFAFQLLRTFMPHALKDARKCDNESLDKIRVASLEDVDLSLLENAELRSEPRTSVEQTFHALVGGQ